MDERATIIAAQQGDHDAFGELVRRYQAQLRGFAARDVQDSQDVYDLVQEAFLDALRHMGSFDVNREFYPWLRAICRNRILNYFRSRKSRRSGAQVLVDVAIEEIAATRDDTDEDPAGRIAALKHCIGRLHDEQRSVVELRYAEGIAVKDIASRFGKSAASITMQLQRIKAALLDCVQRQLGHAHS
jgi:RNA polymerase sigma-70 factor (ECF subfamily)